MNEAYIASRARWDAQLEALIALESLELRDVVNLLKEKQEVFVVAIEGKMEKQTAALEEFQRQIFPRN